MSIRYDPQIPRKSFFLTHRFCVTVLVTRVADAAAVGFEAVFFTAFVAFRPGEVTRRFRGLPWITRRPPAKISRRIQKLNSTTNKLIKVG